MTQSIFEVERDAPCKTTILKAVTERPVAYKGDAHRHMSVDERSEIMILTIPDITKHYLIELWGVKNESS